MAEANKLLLAFYGDDFTGSTDALEFLSRAGIKTMLFINTPTPAQIAAYPGLQAIGIAGMTRSMPPFIMDMELTKAFTALTQLGVLHVHYKVCSTFDSAPHIGSIGKAADVGAKIFNAPFIPLLVAAPALGRYCVFGNLFARMGIGSLGGIFRLDRHPSMSRHPVTPADESDLRLHLGKQTLQCIGLIDILAIDQDETVLNEKVQQEIAGGKQIILFDALREEQLLPIAKLIDQYASEDKPVFSIGSSGIEMAFGKYWTAKGITQPKTEWQPAGKAEAILVVSGSCSPVTAKQIEYAIAHGFDPIGIDTVALACSTNTGDMLQGYIDHAAESISKGISVIVHTSIGSDDQRVAQTCNILAQQGLNPQQISTKTATLYGSALGAIALGVAQKTSLKRLLIAGGDTSGYVARTMGIEAVEMIAPVSPGAPLCLASAPGSAAHGLEVNFKGGQVGSENYFEIVLNGETIT